MEKNNWAGFWAAERLNYLQYRIASLVAVVLIAAGAGAAPYRVETLTLPSGSYSRYLNVGGVSNSGAVTADVTVAGGGKLFRWDPGQSEAAPLAPVWSSASGNSDGFVEGINSSGTVVGVMMKYLSGTNTQRGYQPVVIPGSGAGGRQLEQFIADSGGWAYAINDHGDIVGSAGLIQSGVSVGRAVRWNAGQSSPIALDFLGTSQGSTNGQANGINSFGDVVGYVEDHRTGASGKERAVRWAAGGTALLALPMLPAMGTAVNKRTVALAINDARTMVGNATFYSGFDIVDTRAVLWSADGTTITDLGSGSAIGIDNGANIIGTKDGQSVIWPAGGGDPVSFASLFDPVPGWSFGAPSAISGTGIMAGSASFDPDGAGPIPTNYDVAYRLFPVPEPEGLAGLGLATVLIAARRAQRRRKLGGH
jgi:hypothetical protein